MKKSLLILALCLALAGCTAATPYDHVNAAINRVQYVKDKGDDWKLPSRFYRDGGDCEDYAIAKYYQLKAQGVPKSSMFIVSMKSSPQNHAVLWVFAPDKTYVLDSQSMWVLTPDDYSADVNAIYDWRDIEERVK